MYESDAKRMGKETHTREMTFVKGYVSCNTCACNYGAYDDVRQKTEPVFCQIFSTAKDPAQVEENIKTGENCKWWVHKNLDRNKVISPDHSYHYEKLA